MATSIRVIERRRRYHWPDAQLQFWIFIFLVASSVTLGIFAYFIVVQQTLEQGIPWLFPYQITVSSLGLLFVALIIGLISQRQLLPGIVILGTFILFVLWLTGLVETSIQLFGPSGSVNTNCNLYVTGMPFKGPSIATLAYLEQKSICMSWQAAFSFEVIGTVFLLWLGIMAWQVQRDEYEL
ncbi:hypothetical protein MMC14_004216 [Varicellaria rhodocarpa]|nr:hypothetical protein [Varicellaria rhodocarpa]